LEAIISRGNSVVGPWMRVLAIQVLEQSGKLCDALITNLYSETPLVREASAKAIFKLDPVAFNHYLERLEGAVAQQLRTMVLHHGNSLHHSLSALEKIQWLGRCSLFKDTAHEELVRLAVHVEEIRAVAGSVLIHESQNDPDLYLLTHGRLKLGTSGGEPRFVTPPEVIGEMNPLLWENATVTATGYCRLLRISPQLFFEG